LHPYAFGSWPSVAGPAGETTIVNQIEARPVERDFGVIPAVAGIPSPPVAGPVIYVIAADRGSRRMRVRKASRIRSGPKVVSLRLHNVTQVQPSALDHETGPRIIHVAAHSGR